MITATRRIQFCAGHRVHQHESKCRNMHGHNYVAFFTAEGIEEELDRLGRVIDFSVLKEKIGGWIDKFWDHGFLYWDEDKEVANALLSNVTQKAYSLPYNPTAENMAQYLLDMVCPIVLRGTGVKVTKIVLWETENCYAEVSSQ